jgi:hypothetical protein
VWFAEGHAAGARRNAAKRPAATAVCARPGRSVSGQRQASRERSHIWLIGERAIRPPLGALLSERDEDLGGVPGRAGDRRDCGHGGIGEELRGCRRRPRRPR